VGDIPILGNLFKSTNKGDRQTSLFLFVTPTIMAEPGGDAVLDRESCKRKQKADELIGYTDIYNAQFADPECQDVGCEIGTGGVSSGSAGAYVAPQASAVGGVRGSGSCSDGSCRVPGEATRFLGVSKDRLAAEAAHRRAALKQGASPAGR
jgi:hypothetical protein